MRKLITVLRNTPYLSVGTPAAQLRRVPQHRDQLPHRLVRDVRGDPSPEPPRLQTGGGGGGDGGRTVLGDHASHTSSALDPLDVRTAARAIGPVLATEPAAQTL